MRQYEVALIVHPEVDESGVTALSEKVQGWITSGGGTIEKVDSLGKRKLAYEIRKQREGHYLLMLTKMNASLPPELDRNLRLTEQIMRFMIVRNEGGAASAAAPAPPSETDKQAAE